MNTDASDKRHASRRVAAELLARIDAGVYPPGSPLPAYRQLANEFGVATNTAMVAIRLLGDSGAVTLRPHASALVRDRTTDVDVSSELIAMRTDLAGLRNELHRAANELAAIEGRLQVVSDRWEGSADVGN